MRKYERGDVIQIEGVVTQSARDGSWVNVRIPAMYPQMPTYRKDATSQGKRPVDDEWTQTVRIPTGENP